MRNTLTRVLISALAVAALGAHVGALTQPAKPVTASPAATTDINLMSFANGAWMVKKPPEYDES